LAVLVLPVLLGLQFLPIAVSGVSANVQSVADHVVINEFELNPPGDDRDQEWVEFYNPTALIVDLGGWRLQTTAGKIESVMIPSGASINPDGYYIVTGPGQWLDNENESIILFDKDGREVDRTPVKSDTDDNGYSWQRYPDGAESWVYAPSTRAVINIPEFPSPLFIGAIVLVFTIFVLRRSLPVRGRN